MLLDQFEQDRFLVRKVRVDRPERKASRLGNVADRGSRETLLDDLAASRLDQKAPASFVSEGLAASSRSCCGATFPAAF
jgi:hypothetical protein